MNLPTAVTALISVLVVGDAAIAIRQQAIPIDRWLISETFQPDSAADSRLEQDLLDAPGEVGVLPDRGTETAGTRWSLRRSEQVSLAAQSGSIVYAHAYVRLPEDRTLQLEWVPEDCTAGRLWLNGRPTPGRAFAARFGAGWNTILVKLEAGDCELGFGATLGADDPGALDEVRVQASRPPGDVRTGPEPWVIPNDTVHVVTDRRWKGDRLFAGIAVRVTAWGRTAIPGVRVELKGAADGRGESQWMTPGEATEVVVPVKLDQLERVVDAGTIQSRLRWDEGQLESSLVVSPDVEGPSSIVVLDGWEVSSDGDDEPGEGGLPTSAGWRLAGEWKVPTELEGATLELVTGSSPGDYRVNGTPSADGPVLLCGPCARGAKLEVSVVTSGPWSAMPVIRVSNAAGQ